MLERLLDPAGDGQRQRLAAGRRIGEIFVERALDTGGAVAVDVGIADDVGGEARLRIEPVGLALDREPRLAQRVDRFDQRRRCAAAEIEERLARLQQREILLLALLGHQLGEVARERELVADHLCRVNRDRPRIDRARERLAVAVDDVAALRNQLRSGLPCGRHGRRKRQATGCAAR